MIRNHLSHEWMLAAFLAVACAAVGTLGSMNAIAQNGAAAEAKSDQDRAPQAVPAESSSVPAKPRFFTSTDPNAHVTILEDTPIRVRTNTPIGTKETRENALLSFSLSEDVIVDGVLIVPRGATLLGTVVQNKPAGTLTGKPILTLKLTSLELEGRSYPLYSYQFKVEGTSKDKRTRTNVAGGAAIGAVTGDGYRRATKPESTSVRNLAYAGTGIAVGAGAGTIFSATSSGPVISIPAEAQIDFALAAPISVVPVSPQGAARLSYVIRRSEPTLYVRGQTP